MRMCSTNEGPTILLSTSRFDNIREREIVAQMLLRKTDGIIIATAAPFPGTIFDYSLSGSFSPGNCPLCWWIAISQG